MSSTPKGKKLLREKAKRSAARVAGPKRAPVCSAAFGAFLAVPEKPLVKTPPMTPTAARSGTKCTPPGLDGDSVQSTIGVIRTKHSARSGLNDEDECADLVADLVLPVRTAGHTVHADSSVSESSLWENVGLQAGLSVTSTNEARDAPAKK